MPQLARSTEGAPGCVSDRLAAAVAVVDAFPGSAAVVDPTGVIVAVNATWERFGQQNGRLEVNDIGRNYLEHVAGGPDIPVEARRLYDGVRAVLTGARGRFEQTYPCHAPQTERWFRCDVHPLPGNDGIAGAVLTHIDVSNEVARAVQSDVRLHQMATVAEGIGAYWWDWRIDDDRIEFTPVLAERLGTRRAYTSSEAFTHQHVHPDDRAATEGVLQGVRDGDAVSFDHEFRLMMVDGPQWVHSRGQVMYDASGRADRVVGITLDIADRHALSDELVRERADSRKMALVAERTDNGVVITDPAGRVEWVNAGFERLSGYGLSELAGKRPGDVLQGADTDPGAAAALAGAIAERQPIRREIVNYDRGGRPYWVEIDLQPVFDERGDLVQFIAIQRDVTESKREAGLHAAREVGLRHGLDGDDLSSTLPDVVTALEGAFINARIAVLIPEPGAERLRCLAAPNLPAGVQTLLHDVPVGEAGGVLGRAGAGQRACAVPLAEDRFWAAAGTSQQSNGLVECWVEPLVGLDGRQQGVLALFFSRKTTVDAAKIGFVEKTAHTLGNLIERENREIDLRRSERQFRALAEVLPVFVSYVDRDLRFGYTNAAHDAFLGVPRGSLAGCAMRSVFAEDSWAEVSEQVARVLAGERVRAEAQRQYWDGRQRQVQVTYVPDTGVDGTIAGFYCIVEDVSAFRRREAELRRAKELAQASNAAKSAFLANISHELRTPLNAVIGYSEMMQSEMLGPIGNDTYKGYVDDIHASGKYLLDLIEDVLDLSKLDAGARELAREQVAIASAVDQALVVLGMADAPNLTVEVGAEVTARGDPRAFKQVLINLIGNAAKYAQDASIRVAAWHDGGMCMLEVTDAGPGIPVEEVPRITEPFYTVDQRSWVASDTGGGTGIGLALVKRLVEEMGGRIGIESAPGEGTTVTLRMRTLL